MKYFGCDLSHWNYINSFEAVADSVDFVILKAGGSDKGFYTDSTFKNRYDGFHAYDVPVGAYYFVGAKCLSKADGEADALRFIDRLKGKKFEYPVYMDVEAPPAGKKDAVTEAVIGFCEVMENYGYYVGIYASDISGFKERMHINKLDDYDKWVASYSRFPSYVKEPFGMWQYSSTGKVAGIVGNVDLDICYYDFPAIMKSKHLNGF